MKYYLDLRAAELPEIHQNIPQMIPLLKIGPNYIVSQNELSENDYVLLLKVAQQVNEKDIIAAILVTKKGLPKGAKIITQSED